MSFNTVLTVLFLLVFIVLPLLSRAMRQSSRPRNGGLPPVPPGGRPDAGEAEVPPWVAEAQRRVREARAEASAEASSGAPSGRPPAPPLVPEDARGRSLAAPEGPLVRGDPFERPEVPTAPGDLVPDDPFGRGLAGRGSQAGQAGMGPGQAPAMGQPPMQPAAQPASRQPAAVPTVAGREQLEVAVVAVEAEKAGGKKVEEEIAEVVLAATPAHERRRRSRGGARLWGMGMQHFGARHVVTGVIWHEVLDEPAWRRRQRRASSRPRSR